MIHNRKAMLATALLTLLGAATVAQATDNWTTNRKFMTGAQCQPSNGSQWADFIVNPDGIRNINPSYARYVSCAIPLDADSDYNQADFSTSTSDGPITIELGFDYSQAKIGATVNTVCTLFRRDFSGTIASDTMTVSSARSSSVVSTALAPAMMTGASPFNPDTLSFNCKLNPNIKLLYIKYYEDENTGGYFYSP